MKHVEAMIGLANEARHKAYATDDPLWHAVADLEVARLVELGRALVADDGLTDEPCGFVLEPVVEFAPVWKEALPDALVVPCVAPLGMRPLHWETGVFT